MANPLQYSCLEHPLDGGAWWAIACRVVNQPDMIEASLAHALFLLVISQQPKELSITMIL